MRLGEATFGRLLEIHERVLGPDRPGAAAILNELALTIGHQSRFDDADRVFGAGREGRAGVVRAGRHPDPLRLPRLRAPRQQSGRRPAVRSEQSVTIAERFAETSRGRPFSLAIHAVVLRTNKRPVESEAEALKAIQMFERPGQDPEWRLWWVGELHELLGRLYREQGRFADARREFGLGLARREMLFGEAAPRSIEGHVWLAMTEQSAGDLDAALKHYRRAADLQISNRAALEGARLPSVLSLSRCPGPRPPPSARPSGPRCPPRRSRRCRFRAATRDRQGRCVRWPRVSAVAKREARGPSRAICKTSTAGAPAPARRSPRR